MIQHYRRQRIINLFFAVLIILSFSLSVMAQFRDDLDRRIAKDLIRSFAAGCALRVSTDFETIDQINLEIAEARRSRFSEVQKCFDTYFSQIQGVVFLYEKACGEITASVNQNISENRLAWQLLTITKYEAGMRPYHSSLNDCLLNVPGKRGRRFVVPLGTTGFSVKELKSQLDAIEIKDPYVHTPEPFR